MIPKFALNEKILDGYAELYEWVKVEVPNNANYMVSYRKDDIRLNFWLTTATVGSYLYHPKKKHKTQLFRRSITMDEAEGIFINPRRHTGIIIDYDFCYLELSFSFCALCYFTFDHREGIS